MLILVMIASDRFRMLAMAVGLGDVPLNRNARAGDTIIVMRRMIDSNIRREGD